MQASRRNFLLGAAALGTGALLSQSVAAQMFATPKWQIGFKTAPASGFAPKRLRLIDGKLPTGLSGSLYRNGPAHFQYGGTHASHWFDGDGMVQLIHFADGKAIHSGRFVQTRKRRAEQSAGRFLAPGFGSEADPSYPVESADDVSAANTSVLKVGDDLLALWEAGSPIRLDPVTLETRGSKQFRSDLKGMPFLAHPKVEPGGRIWNLAVRGPHVGIYNIDPTGHIDEFGVVNIGRGAYIHDWAMTERHLIVLVQPWLFEDRKPPFVNGLRWEPEEGLKFLIIDKADFQNRRWAQGDARAFFHTGGAWEDRDGTIRLDVSLYREPVLGEDGGRAEIMGTWKEKDLSYRSDLTQIIIPLNGDARYIETGLDGDFAQINPHFSGHARTLTALVSHSAKSHPGATGVSLHNWKTGRTNSFIFGENYMVEEFLFVPKPDAKLETDSWLVGPVINLKKQRHEICVFDASDLNSGPICRLAADYAWPLGFHGTWA